MNPTDKNKPDITVIMPALNEEKNIRAAMDASLLAFGDFKLNGELLVINDGSTDGTEKIIEDMIKKDSRVRMVKHETPHGFGASFWDGVDASAGTAVVVLPGDNENDPSEILRYFSLLEHVDLIIPFAFNKEVREGMRNFISSVYRFIINMTFGVSFNYTNGTIIYRCSLLKEMPHRNKSFFFQTDILIRAAKGGYLFAEVPYRLGKRADGTSKALSFSSLRKVIKGYARLVVDYYFGKDKGAAKSFTNDSMTSRRRQWK